MDVLDQPLEAVALHIYSLPEVAAPGAAAWTCLAAVLAAAAAAGLWRLRSSGTHVVSEGEKPLELDNSPAPSVSLPEPERPPESPPGTSPRERYTAYYYDSGCVGCCDVDDDDVDEVDQDLEDGDKIGVYGPSSGTDPFEWEVVRSLPDLMTTTAAAAAAAGTGRYRNTTALSGSVVRLWDESSTPAASPRRRGRALAGTISAF